MLFYDEIFFPANEEDVSVKIRPTDLGRQRNGALLWEDDTVYKLFEWVLFDLNFLQSFANLL
jgi:hypothetical protein